MNVRNIKDMRFKLPCCLTALLEPFAILLISAVLIIVCVVHASSQTKNKYACIALNNNTIKCGRLLKITIKNKEKL